ncbi:MAG TPA: hypothetical protein VMW65_16820, partial [Chloroflexota bacterium]|nr:hypothetical protein [Chloroflexota bacterium]
MIRVAPFAPLRASQRDAGYVVGFGWVFFLAAFVRVTYIMASRFPLHDGGLFFQMIQDLQAAHYRLPLVTSYNQAGIPFAYPPLAFYVAGWLSDLMHWPLIGVLWLLPPFLSLLCLGAFVLLAQRLLPDRGLVILASLAFALAPRAYDWLIMGGGLTRAFGQLFALLFLHRLHRVYTVRRRADVVLAAAFGAATVLSHLEWTYFAAYSALVFLAILGRDRWSMAASAVIAAGSALISAPWWVTVLSRDGLAPFIAAVTGSSHDWPLYSGVVAFLTLRWTEEPLFPLLTALAI